MEPVDQVSKAMEILRREMSENLDRLKRAGKLPSQRAPRAAANPSATSGRREAGEALVAAALQRPITADGKTMFEHIQHFVRQQAAQRSRIGEAG